MVCTVKITARFAASCMRSVDIPSDIGEVATRYRRCVQLRRLPARRLCRRPHGMAPMPGECPERTALVDVNMNVTY